jgi:hypothetical protein
MIINCHICDTTHRDLFMMWKNDSNLLKSKRITKTIITVSYNCVFVLQFHKTKWNCNSKNKKWNEILIDESRSERITWIMVKTFFNFYNFSCCRFSFISRTHNNHISYNIGRWKTISHQLNELVSEWLNDPVLDIWNE